MKTVFVLLIYSFQYVFSIEENCFLSEWFLKWGKLLKFNKESFFFVLRKRKEKNSSGIPNRVDEYK